MADYAVPLEDRQRHCIAQFDARLRERLKATITDAMIAEHKAKPAGQHSDALERVLHYFRRAPAAGKYAILMVKPFAEYRLMALSGRRGVAPTPVGDAVYASPEEAYHAVFLKRIDDLRAS